MTPEQEVKTLIKKVAIGFGIFMLLVVFFGSFYTIGAGERGILSTFGNPEMVPYAEGLHFKWPIVQSVTIMDIKTQKYEHSLAGASKDLQTVNSVIAINYRIKSEDIVNLYKTVGVDYSDTVITPIASEVNKAITSSYTAEELITKRERVREDMMKLLSERLMNRGILVEEISIINFDFSAEFNKAIESKVVSEQLKLQKIVELEQNRILAESKIVLAQAEAESLRLQKQEITPELLRLREIENQKSAIEKWSGTLPTTTCGGAVPFIGVN